MDDPGWDLGPEMRVRVCGKLDVLDRILPKLKEAGHRVLIYSQMVQLLEILAEYIEEQGYKYHKLIGATASDQRASMIEDFNRPESDVFLFILSTRAGGQGVNLQSADTVIIFDSDWNPMMDEQAKARINRIGQTKQTLVIRLMTPGTVEEKMLSRANARLRMGDLVIEAGAFKVGASSKDAQALLREKLDQDGILADIAQIDQEVATDHDINELMMRTDHEFEMWRRMDEERLKNAKDSKPRLMQEDEVPERLLGEPIEKGDRVEMLDGRLAAVSAKGQGHEWVVQVDDGELLTVHRTELMLAAPVETEETHEAARLARRKVTNRDHSVTSPPSIPPGGRESAFTSPCARTSCRVCLGVCPPVGAPAGLCAGVCGCACACAWTCKFSCTECTCGVMSGQRAGVCGKCRVSVSSSSYDMHVSSSSYVE